MTGAAAEEVLLEGGGIEAVVLPGLGARLDRLRAFGHDLLRTPDHPLIHRTDPFFWGAYVMAPWCNRMTAAPIRVGERTVDVPANFPDGSAIHGQVYVRPWERVGDASFRVRGGGDGWPWPYRCELDAILGLDALRLDLRLVNEADEPMPAGLGLHPWFMRPVDVAVAAERVHEANAEDGPAEPVPVAGVHDLRRLAPMAPDLDATWTAIGEPPVRLRWVDAGIDATVRFDAPARYVCAASPTEREAIALEPQTHAPGGLRRFVHGEPGGLVPLGPGETLALGIEIAFTRLASPA